MNVLTPLNQCCRHLDRQSFDALGMTDKLSVIGAVNKALADVHNALPTHFRQVNKGAVLGPSTRIGSMDSSDSYISGVPKAVAGRSFTLDSDPIMNRFLSDVYNKAGVTSYPAADTMFPADLDSLRSATPSGTLYDDIIRLDSRVKSVKNVSINGQFNLPLTGTDEGGFIHLRDLIGYTVETVSTKSRELADDAYGDQAQTAQYGSFGLNSVSLLIRIYPIPTETIRVTYTAELGPWVISLSDTIAGRSIGFLEEFNGDIVTLAEAELSLLAIYKGDVNKAQAAATQTKSRLSLLVSKPDAGRINRRGRTPGY